MTEKTQLTKEQKSEIKQLRKTIANDYKMLKKSVAPEIQIAHLEKIILNYKKIYTIQPVSFGDKAVFKMLIVQYKAMCSIRKVKPNPYLT